MKWKLALCKGLFIGYWYFPFLASGRDEELRSTGYVAVLRACVCVREPLTKVGLLGTHKGMGREFGGGPLRDIL